MIEVLCGNTDRVYSYFYDLNNPDKLIDPDEVIFTVYDQKWTKLSETILSDTNKKSLGVYFYDYVAPDEKKISIYRLEFKGIVGGKPSLNNTMIKTVPEKSN